MISALQLEASGTQIFTTFISFVSALAKKYNITAVGVFCLFMTPKKKVLNEEKF